MPLAGGTFSQTVTGNVGIAGWAGVAAEPSVGGMAGTADVPMAAWEGNPRGGTEDHEGGADAVMGDPAPREAVENWGLGATAGVAGEAGMARPPGEVIAGVARCAGVATLTPLGIEAGAFTASGLTDGKVAGAPL